MENEITIRKIYFGDDCIEMKALPDGNYLLDKRDVTNAIGESEESIEEFNTENGGLSVLLTDAGIYWGMMSQKGNKLATELLVACAIDAIERRTDKAIEDGYREEVEIES